MLAKVEINLDAKGKIVCDERRYDDEDIIYTAQVNATIYEEGN